jgi:hypothetical protein
VLSPPRSAPASGGAPHATSTGAPRRGTGGASPAPRSAGGAAADFAARSPDFEAFVARAQAVKAGITQRAQARKAQIVTEAGVHKGQARAQVDQRRSLLETTRAATVAQIATDEQQVLGRIANTRTSQQSEIAAASVRHVQELSGQIARKKQAVIALAGTKSEAAHQHGRTLSARVQTEVDNHKAALRRLLTDLPQGAVADAHQLVEQACSSIDQAGHDTLGTVATDGQALANKFTREGRDTAATFDDSFAGGEREITDADDRATRGIRQLCSDAEREVSDGARSAQRQVEQQGQAAHEGLDAHGPDGEAQIDAASAHACQHVDELARTAADGIQRYVDGLVPEIGPYPASLDAENLARADAQVVGMGTGFDDQLAGVSRAFTAGGEQVVQAVGGALQQPIATAHDAITRAADRYATGAHGRADEVGRRATDTTGHTSQGQSDVVTRAGDRLQQAHDRADRTWSDELRDGQRQMDGKVDQCVTRFDQLVTRTRSDVDHVRSEASSDRGLGSRILGAIGSFFSGLWDAFVEFARSLPSALLVLLVIALVVVAICAIIALVVVLVAGGEFLLVLGAILAAVWEFVQVVLVIVGILFAIYAIISFIVTLIQVILDPNITLEQALYRLGHSFFNIILAALDIITMVKLIGNLGKLLELLRTPSMLLRLLREAGSVAGLLRLLSKVEDVAELLRLLERVGDAGVLLRLLSKTRTVSELIELLDEVPEAARLLALLENAKIASAAQLLELLRNERLGGLANLERLLGNAKIASGAQLLELLRNAKITDLADLEALLGNAKIGSAQELLDLLGNAKITDLAVLQRLLGNAKIGSARQLLDLLNHAKIPDLATLDRLLANAKIASGGELLELLNHAKIPDLATLEALLGHAKIAGARELLDLLNDAKVTDPATLTALLDDAKIADGAQLLRLLRHAKIPDLATLQGLLANAKVGDGAVLLDLLDDAKIPSAADLVAILASPKINNADTLRRLIRLVDDLPQLQRLLADAKVTHGVPLAMGLELCDSAARFERMLGLSDDLAQLTRLLRGAGAQAGAAKLEEILDFVGAGNASKVDRMARVAGGNAGVFGQMVDWAKMLPHQAPPPVPPAAAVPPECATFGFTAGANMPHFFEHTWEFINIALRNGKDTTFFPTGSAGNISTMLGEALRRLNPPGTHPALPIPGTPSPSVAGTLPVQVGSEVHGAGTWIGQFFPLAGTTIPWVQLEAIWHVLR